MRKKTYSELNRTIIKEKLSSIYRIWLILRHLDTHRSGKRGCGVVGIQELRVELERLGLNWRHFDTAQKKDCSRHFFVIVGDRIEYTSLKNLCLTLGCKSGKPVLISDGCFAKLGTFNANLYGAWLKAQGNQIMISRDRLGELFGISNQTQRNWERDAGINVIQNVVQIDPKDWEVAQKYIPTDSRGERLDQRYFWEGKDGYIYYRTVNSYQATQQYMTRVGNTRKVDKHVRAVLGVELCGDATEQQSQVFYMLRDIPDNHQNVKGHCLRDTGTQRSFKSGQANIFLFSEYRPVSRQSVFSA